MPISMSNTEPQFPLYRKYPDNKTYFKVIGPEAFEEIRRIGNRYELHTYQAEKLPDRNLVEDLIREEGAVETASSSEYEHFKQYCLEHLSPLG